LPRFCGLHPAVTSVEKNTLAIRLFEKRKAIPILPQPRVTLDEIMLGYSKKTGHSENVVVVDFYEPGPAAAIGTTLALVVNLLFHENGIPSPGSRGSLFLM